MSRIVLNAGDLIPYKDEVFRVNIIQGTCWGKCDLYGKKTNDKGRPICCGICTRYANMEEVAFEYVGNVSNFGAKDLVLTDWQKEEYERGAKC